MSTKRKHAAQAFFGNIGRPKEETLETTNEEINEPSKEETNVSTNEPRKEETKVPTLEEPKQTTKEEKKIERKRVSFDIRTDLHREFKMMSILEDENIYILIERAMERFLEERKK